MSFEKLRSWSKKPRSRVVIVLVVIALASLFIVPMIMILQAPVPKTYLSREECAGWMIEWKGYNQNQTPKTWYLNMNTNEILSANSWATDLFGTLATDFATLSEFGKHFELKSGMALVLVNSHFGDEWGPPMEHNGTLMLVRNLGQWNARVVVISMQYVITSELVKYYTVTYA